MPTEQRRPAASSGPTFTRHRALIAVIARAAQRGAVRRGHLLIVLVIAVLAAGGGWYWWQSRAAKDGGATGVVGTAGGPAGAASGASGGGGGGGRRFGGGGANRTQPVTVAAVRKQDVKVILNAIGNISALNTAIVRARVEGELQVIRFKEGQMVRAGQVLADIDPRSFQVALSQVQGQLARDQAQLRNAQIDLERYKELLSKDSIAKQQVDTQEALVRQLTGTVQADQAVVDNAKLQLSFTKVVAPISGRLGLKQADLGNIVRGSDANGIVTITQTQPISVVFAVPEANLPAINRKLQANQALQVEAWDREQRSRLATGTVRSTDNAIDPVTGTIKLKAEFPNADGTLFPNQFVNIKLQVDTLESVLTVPSAAVQRGAQGTFVYVVKDDGTVTSRRIRLGTTEGDFVSVQGDVSAGERVVTDGADRLREGAKVDVIVPNTLPPGAPGGRGGRRGGAAQAPLDAASGAGPAAMAAPAASGPVGSGAQASGDRPPWLERLPPDVRERVLKMSPEERREFMRAQREKRQQGQ